jgi:hypothetical protein
VLQSAFSTAIVFSLLFADGIGLPTVGNIRARV